jgi:hypothetical protein
VVIIAVGIIAVDIIVAGITTTKGAQSKTAALERGPLFFTRNVYSQIGKALLRG